MGIALTLKVSLKEMVVFNTLLLDSQKVRGLSLPFFLIFIIFRTVLKY